MIARPEDAPIPELKIPTKPAVPADPTTALQAVVEPSKDGDIHPDLAQALQQAAATGKPATVGAFTAGEPEDAPGIRKFEETSAAPAETGEMMRFNSGKVRLHLIPPSLNYYTGMVLEYGAIKYDSENWRKGCKWTDMVDSLQRHIDSFRAGEDCDDESKLPHLAHMAFNVMALIEFFDKGIGTDDRYRYPHQAAGQRAPGRLLQFRRPPGRE